MPTDPADNPPTQHEPAAFPSIKRQFFAAFFVVGAVQPFLPVWLDERGFGREAIGRIGALPGLAVLVAPVLLTLLADTRWSNRRTLGLLFVLGAAALGGMLGAYGLVAVAAVYLAYSLVSTPLPSLQDGMYFAASQPSEAGSKAAPGYHIVRMWGTLGFIAAALSITPMLYLGFGINVAIWAGVIGSLVGAVNAWTLPRPEDRKRQEATAVPRPGGRVPTLRALRACGKPPLLMFMSGMFLVQAAVGSYYSFFALYLTQLLGLDKLWVGPIVNIGVVLEVAFLFGFGWMVRTFGVRRLMLVSLLITCLRFGLLWIWVDLWLLMGLQVIHGFMVLLVHVLPPIYLNRFAEPAFRNSIQGVYAMIAMGVGRFVGSWVSGDIAASDAGLNGMFGVSAAVMLVGGLMVVSVLRNDEGAPGGT